MVTVAGPQGMGACAIGLVPRAISPQDTVAPSGLVVTRATQSPGAGRTGASAGAATTGAGAGSSGAAGAGAATAGAAAAGVATGPCFAPERSTKPRIRPASAQAAK